MILILTGDGDVSSDLVIEILKTKGVEFIRINAHDFLEENYFFELASNTFIFGDKKAQGFIKVL